jgi:tetratricopeptide (TPR) repeat protein
MWVVASTVLILAATSTLPIDAPPQGSFPSVFPSEEALRRYAQGRLLEERGEGNDALSEYYRALLLDPQAASVARRVSELSSQVGEPERSLEFAERSLALAPDNARSLWLKGAALFNLGRAKESLEPLAAAARADSSRIEYLQTLARVAEHLDRMDVVARAYSRAVELDAEDGESWFQLAAAKARLGDFTGAEKALARASTLNAARPGTFFLEGWVQEGLGHPRPAIQLYRRHLAIHSGDQVTRRRLVNLLAGEKRFAEAYREAAEVSRARPEDPEVLEVEADLAFRANLTQRALRVVDRMRRRAGSDPDAVARVVALLARNGRARAGLAMADAWESHHPSDCRAPMLAARARALAGQPDAAVERARRSVEACPDSLAPRVLLGGLYQSNRRFREAEAVWLEAARRFPSNPGIALDLAFCREQLGDLDGAQQAARDALKIESDNPTVLNFLGYLLADHDRNLDEAVDLIRRAIEKDPDNGAFIDSLGWVYYRLGRLEDARVHLERAVDLTGGDPVVREHLGDVYNDLRLFDLAREQYRKSLGGNASNERVRSKLARTR